MSDLDIEVNEALDAYVAYFSYDGDDEIDNEDLRWNFIDRAVDILEKLAGRDVTSELV